MKSRLSLALFFCLLMVAASAQASRTVPRFFDGFPPGVNEDWVLNELGPDKYSLKKDRSGGTFVASNGEVLVNSIPMFSLHAFREHRLVSETLSVQQIDPRLLRLAADWFLDRIQRATRVSPTVQGKLPPELSDPGISDELLLRLQVSTDEWLLLNWDDGYYRYSLRVANARLGNNLVSIECTAR